LPPARTLVAVRAMAPVAGNPPNNAEAIFAAPCASSSAFERCALEIIRSATLADNSDSTPARKAMTMADGNNSLMRINEISGSDGLGK